MTTRFSRSQRAHFQDILPRLGWPLTLWPDQDVDFAFHRIEEAVHEAAHRVLMKASLDQLDDTAKTDEMLYDYYASARSRDRQEIQTSAVTYLVVKDLFAECPEVAGRAFDHVVASAGGNLKQLKLTGQQVHEAVAKSLESRVTQRVAKKLISIARGI